MRKKIEVFWYKKQDIGPSFRLVNLAAIPRDGVFNG